MEVVLWWFWVAVGVAAGGMEVERRPLANDRHGLSVMGVLWRPGLLTADEVVVVGGF
ncbi:hypothetical protein Dimus_033620, partial [Dionaea muscipula]